MTNKANFCLNVRRNYKSTFLNSRDQYVKILITLIRSWPRALSNEKYLEKLGMEENSFEGLPETNGDIVDTIQIGNLSGKTIKSKWNSLLRSFFLLKNGAEKWEKFSTVKRHCFKSIEFLLTLIHFRHAIVLLVFLTNWFGKQIERSNIIPLFSWTFYPKNISAVTFAAD